MNVQTVMLAGVVAIIYILIVKLIFPSNDIFVSSFKELSLLDLFSVFSGKSSENRISELRVSLFIVVTVALIACESLLVLFNA